MLMWCPKFAYLKLIVHYYVPVIEIFMCVSIAISDYKYFMQLIFNDIDSFVKHSINSIAALNFWTVIGFSLLLLLLFIEYIISL